MDDFLHSLWNKGNSPYVRAFGLFLIILLAELGFVSTISGIGYATEVQNYRNSIWVASLAIAFLIAVFWLVAYLRRPRNIEFLKNTQDGKFYLKDLHGKAREIPDNDTYSYLTVTLGATDTVIDISPKELDKIRGEKLVSPKKFERPMTSDEKNERELRYKVSEELEKVDVSFVHNTSPQKIVVLVANRGKKLIHIQNIKFQPHKLSQESFPAFYTKIDASYIGIPFPENKANLEAGQSLQIEMELRQKWQRADIEKIRGELGFLSFDVIYEGKHVNEILKTI
jgi:hypothetical protein